jgi:hypothetical protein
MRVDCAELSGGATAENPKGGAAGRASERWNLGSCAVAEPPACFVRPLEFSTESVATEFETKPALKFSPSSGTTLFELSFEGASCGLKGVSMKVVGTFTGIQSSSGFEVTEASNSLNIGTAKAYFLGSAALKTASGVLRLTP